MPTQLLTQPGYARWAPVILAVCVFIAYCNSFVAPFTFDDNIAIVENPYVRSLWPLREAMKAPPQSSVAGRPIVSISLAISYAIFGLNAWGFRLQNIVIHILAGLVLFWIIQRTLSMQERWRSWATPVALLGALLWAVHPLQTQAVTYVIQRAESMMGLFYLATLYFFIRGAQARQAWPWYLASLISCALGMGTKEVMATAPLAVLVYDWIFLSGSFKAMLRRWPVHAALLATLAILVMILAGNPRSASTGFHLAHPTPLEYARSQFGVISHYLRLAVWPIGLCFDYQWPIANAAREIVPPLLLILVLLGLTAWTLVRRPRWGFLGVWFFLILAPTSTIYPIEDLAFEQRMYLPLAAVCIFAIVGAARILHGGIGVPPSKKPIVAIGVALTLLLMGLTLLRNYDYRPGPGGTDYWIWRDVVEKRPSNARGYLSLANALSRSQNYAEAIPAAEKALSIDPKYGQAHYNLAHDLEMTGQMNEAIDHYKQAIEIGSQLTISPYQYQAHYNLGCLYLEGEQFGHAEAEFRTAIDLRPYDPMAYNNLAITLVKRGQNEEAIAVYRKAVDVAPDFLDVRLNIATLLANAGNKSEALEHLHEAIRIAPGNAHAQALLSNLQQRPEN